MRQGRREAQVIRMTILAEPDTHPAIDLALNEYAGTYRQSFRLGLRSEVEVELMQALTRLLAAAGVPEYDVEVTVF